MGGILDRVEVEQRAWGLENDGDVSSRRVKRECRDARTGRIDDQGERREAVGRNQIDRGRREAAGSGLRHGDAVRAINQGAGGQRPMTVAVGHGLAQRNRAGIAEPLAEQLDDGISGREAGEGRLAKVREPDPFGHPAVTAGVEAAGDDRGRSGRAIGRDHRREQLAALHGLARGGEAASGPVQVPVRHESLRHPSPLLG